MQIPILIEPVPGNGFRAKAGDPFALTAEGATREEALQKLRELIDQRLAAGAEILSLQLGKEEHPLAKFAGMFKDDPLFDEWQQAIAENRRLEDEKPQVF